MERVLDIVRDLIRQATNASRRTQAEIPRGSHGIH